MDLRKFLEIGIIYDSFQSFFDGGARKTMVSRYVKPQNNDKILDIGCGTGNIYKYVKNSDYTGIDLNKNYIEFAKSKYKEGNFICDDLKNLNFERPFSKIIGQGLLHHLSDEEVDILINNLKKIMSSGSKLITMDPYYYENQGFVSKFFCDNDRGNHIRKFEEYYDLVKEEFHKVLCIHAGKLDYSPKRFCVMICSDS